MTKKAILLVRVSTNEQSLDAQQNDVLYKALSDGYREDEILTIAYKESGIRLSDEERRGLTDMYAAVGIIPNPDYNPSKTNIGVERYIRIATDKRIEVVYVWELSRLSRKELTLMLLKDYFCDNHIQFICVSQGIKLLESDGSVSVAADMMFSIFAITCKTEMMDKKNRFHRTKVAFAQQGLFSGGANVKYGYCVGENRKYQIHPEESRLVQLIFNLYESGLSHIGIARELHERGYTKIRNTVLKATHVRKILASREYTGSHTGLRGIQRIYPVIVSAEQFDRCREIACQNNTKAFLKCRYIYFCNNLIRCSCGRFWVAQHAAGTYLCFRSRVKDIAANYRDAGCENKQSISINILDSLAWHLVARKEAVYIREKACQDAETLKADINILCQKIFSTRKASQKIQQSLERSKELYKMGDISREEYMMDKLKFQDARQKVKNNVTNWTNEMNRLEDIIEKIIDESHSPDSGDVFLKPRIRSVRNITDDVMRQNIIHKHIREIKVNDYRQKISKLLEFSFTDGSHEKYVYDYRHISQKNNDGKRCASIYRLSCTNTLREIKYRFLKRF
ncbi:MAG: recombinase family protein [Bacteroidales bacterium]|jgi:DNA invertase Pin-like site-specific DNA recombinase|nr:recombinase family protein [Bacteroidales bacterium]